MVIKWKCVLEKIQVYLGNIESQIIYKSKFTDKILGLFNLEHSNESLTKIIESKDTNKYFLKYNLKLYVMNLLLVLY